MAEKHDLEKNANLLNQAMHDDNININLNIYIQI